MGYTLQKLPKEPIVIFTADKDFDLGHSREMNRPQQRGAIWTNHLTKPGRRWKRASRAVMAC